MTVFIPKADLVSQHWYVVNINLAKTGVQMPGLNPHEDIWDSVVGGPFGSQAEAEQWRSSNPQLGGPSATVEFHYG